MAIGLNLTKTQYGVSFPNAYGRIVTAAISRQNKGSEVKYSVMIDVAIYADQVGAGMDNPREVQFERLHTDLRNIPTGVDFLNGCYQWLMTQEVFAGATEAQVDFVPNADGVLIPQAVTMRQARLALLNAGLLDDVNTLLADDQEALINWEFASHVYRSDKLVGQLQGALGMTDEQIDGLFLAASKL
jgi:hypothetical protein